MSISGHSTAWRFRRMCCLTALCLLAAMSAAAHASAATLADQQKLTGPRSGASREISAGALGTSVALASNGTIALVGAANEYRGGAAWIYERTGGEWKVVQKLRAPAAAGPYAYFGSSVALSANGNTAAISGSGNAGAIWIFVRQGASWDLRGRLSAPAEGAGAERGSAQFGTALAISANGNTLLAGGPDDAHGAGAAWVFTHAKRGWVFQRELNAPTHGTQARTGAASFGSSVALSPSGETAVIGGPGDTPLPGNDSAVGAAWVFTRSGSSWPDQGKLTAPVNGPDQEINTDISGGAFGSSVGVSASGDLALIGGAADNNLAGAVWVYSDSSGTWSEGAKLTAPSSGPDVAQGDSVGFGSTLALTPAGTTALIGGPGDSDSTGLPLGAAWLFTAASGTWSEQQKLDPPTSGPDRELNPGGGTASQFGSSVALTPAGATALIGGPSDDDPSPGEPYPDNGGPGAAWVFGATSG